MAQILDFPVPRAAMGHARLPRRVSVPAINARRREAAGAMQMLRLWLERRRERAQMARLIAAMPAESIADFAMTRETMEAECRKPFWRA